MDSRLRVVRIIWAAFLMSQLVFPVVAFVVERPPAPPEPLLLPALAVVALTTAIASMMVPARLLAITLQRMNLAVTEQLDTAPGRFGGFYRDAAGKQRVFAEPEKAIVGAFPAFQTSLILAVALSESVTIFGLVLAMLGFAPVAFVPFFLAGFVLVAIRFPTLTALRRSLERTYGASLGGGSG